MPPSSSNPKQFGYVFSIREYRRRVAIDGFIDVSDFLGDAAERKKVAEVRARILGNPDPFEASKKKISADIEHMRLRIRCNASNMHGPLYIYSTSKWTPEELEEYVDKLSEEEFDEFCRKAKF